MTALVIILLFLISYSAFSGSAESSFTSVNKIKVRSLADEGDKKAKKANYILNNYDRALTTLLVSNNLANIAISSVATLIALRIWRQFFAENISEENFTVISTVITTLVLVLFGEIIPKTFGKDKSLDVARSVSGLLRLIMKILAPITAFFGLASKLATRFFSGEAEPSITEEELYDIIDTIEEEGVMDKTQSESLKSALEFSGTTVADVMTMRADIDAIDIKTKNEDIIQFIKKTNHSRIPVYSGDLDHVVGILYVRNLIKAYHKNPKVNVRTMLSEPFKVSGSEQIEDLLTVMRQHKITVAIVTEPQSGRTIGLVTIEDFLEELVGEIWDEDDIYDEEFISLGGNRYLVDAKLTVGEAMNRMGCPAGLKACRQTPYSMGL